MSRLHRSSYNLMHLVLIRVLQEDLRLLLQMIDEQVVNSSMVRGVVFNASALQWLSVTVFAWPPVVSM